MDVAQDLAEWLGPRVVRFTEIAKFYRHFPAHKDVIRGHGLSNFLEDHAAFFSTARYFDTPFMFRMQQQRAVETFCIKFQAADPLTELSRDLALFRDERGRVPLEVMEACLEPLRDDAGSMTKFAKLVRAAGMSLSTGRLYGRSLRRELQANDGEQKVPLQKVKRFRLLKKCLVNA